VRVSAIVVQGASETLYTASPGVQGGLWGAAMGQVILPEPPNGLELREAALCASCPAARATAHTFSRILAGKRRSNFPHASRVSCSESLCGKPEIANRVPTHSPGRAPAIHSGPTSGSIRASPKGQVPTGPTFHTVWRVVMRRSPL
jgi:hypothetical protein